MLLGVVLLAGVLAVLAKDFRTAPDDARAARDALTAARDALAADDAATAQAQVDLARRHTDALQASVQGLGGDVWSVLPVAGGPVRDVRHLADALDDLTAAAEIGVGTWPMLTTPGSGLLRGSDIDLDALAGVSGAAREVDGLLADATASLAGVADSRLLTGTRLAKLRDEARSRAEPLARAAHRAVPVLDQLPSVLGGEGRRTYLVAMLNPAEQRYSGGAPLALAPLVLDHGRMEVGDPVDTLTPGAFRRMTWPKVPGNPFHRRGIYISAANLAPSWSVSGEELANAWAKQSGQPVDGVVAVDLAAVADLMRVTGPITLGRRTYDADNLVSSLVGSYDEFDADNERRKQLTRRLVPLFAERAFSPDGALDKVESLQRSAEARRLALWFADDASQEALAGAGFSGDLSTTDHDYLGVFNQNVHGSKADYWQQRTVRSRVEVAADGSARVELRIDVHNDSPPWTLPYPDPQGGSFVTRWNQMELATFLPRGVSDLSLQVDGREQPAPRVGEFFDRPFVRTYLKLRPQQRRTVRLAYTVPDAATRTAGGGLSYALDVDPHSLVRPQPYTVQVSFPAGLRVTSLPEGWTASGGTARWHEPDLRRTGSFEVTASP